MTTASTDTGTLRDLLTPECVRSRCAKIFSHGMDGALPWFRIDLDNMEDATERVVAEIRANYPALDVPFHSRWRHFEFDGADLWAQIAGRQGLTGPALAAAAGDIAIVSVLLDAGAGPDWTYNDEPTGLRLGRSEGLALASLRLFEAGLLSAEAGDPLRADAVALKALTAAQLADALQVGPDNPLVGIEQRAGLLQRLGQAIDARRDIFGRGDTIRPGHLIAGLAEKRDLQGRDILIALLDNLMDIWPSPIRIDGTKLGDVGRHRALTRADATDNIVPFHKLSQWLAYSLIEPLEKAGARVTALDGLTGLAEYRNGGLFIDTGIIALKDPDMADIAHDPASEMIVEWRALTVALLDRVAEDVRKTLGLTAEQLPLASVLQGGTWSAGRRIAGEKRPGGGPPLIILSDATVF